MVCDKAIAKLGHEQAELPRHHSGIRQRRLNGREADARGRIQNRRLADVHGGLYNEKGFDIPKVVDWVHTQHKSLPDFPGGGQKMSSTEVLFQPCDILVPAAVENQITSENASRVQTKILCEGANGPRRFRRMNSRQEGRFYYSGYFGQCRRSDGQLLRMGARPPGIFLAGDAK